MTNGSRIKIPAWHSLKTRATVFTLFIFVLSIWSLSFFVNRNLQTDMERMLGEQQFSVVSAVAKEINDNLTDRMRALDAIAAQMDVALLNNPTALQTQLEQLPLLQLLFNGGAWVAGLDGTAIADVPRSANRLGVNYMDRDFMIATLKEGKSAISRPIMGKQLKSPVFGMSVPVRDSRGTVIGAIVGVTDLGKPSFLDKITQNPYGKTGGYLLLSAQHRLIVTATDKSRIMLPSPAPGLNAMHDRIMQGYTGYGLAVSSRGVLELSAVKDIPLAGWYAVAVLPAQEAFAPIATLQKRLFWATLVLTLLSGALTWWILRHQLAPLVETAAALAALADSAQIPKPLSNTQKGEIGQLVTGFNRILQTWTQREQSLKASESFKDAVLNSLDAEIVVIDHNGVIQAVNARWQEFAKANSAEPGEPAHKTGVGSNYLAACSASTDMEPQDGFTTRAGLQAVLEGRLPSFSYEYPCNSPSEQRWFAMIAMPLGESGKGGAVIAHTDISQRKHAERAVQRLQTMMERTESMAHLASFQWEVDSNTVTWSPEMFRIFGRDPAQGTPNLEGQAQLYTAASTQMLYDAVGKALVDGTPYELELMTVQPHGEMRPCIAKGFPQRDASGRVVRITGLVQDITERKRREEKLRLAASVFTHSREGITITNADGIIIDVNEAFTRITGYTREEAIGQNPRFLNSGRQDEVFYTTMWSDLTGSGHWSGEIWNRRKSGEVYAELLTISAVRDERGTTEQYLALFSDITAIKAHQSQLEHIAHFDPLTNLPNRLLLADRLQQAMTQAQRRGMQVAVAYLDLDGFKGINDQHGHDAGDQLLINLATAMKDTLREGDTLARLGGDEFVAVLIDLDSTESCEHMLNRLLGAAAQPVQWNGVALQCSASIGVTFYPQEQAVEPDQLLRQADQAMYQAKLAGRNRYHFF